MQALSRRRFLQVSAGAASLAVAGGAATQARSAREPGARGADRVRKVPTFCDVCFWKCGAIAYVKNDRLWKIEGNPEDPLSRGRLCPRGTGGVGAHFDTQRLTAPLMRKQVRGAEEWVAVTWDEALTHVAGKMKEIAAKHGPEAMAFFSHGIGGNFLKHTLKAYGTPNIAAPSYAQCRGPRDVGFQLTFGEEVGSPERTDIRNARCLTLLGSHLGENMHNTQAQEFAEAVGSGASIIVVDPRLSVAASKAKYYLPIKPGTDTALLLAWMNVLLAEGLYDREYVAAHGFGFDAFAAEIAPFTPEWAYPITTIPPELIRASAREMARHRPASLVHPGRHVTWYGNDAQRSRAIALLNALLGTWGRKGGFYQPASMDVPEYPYPPYPHPERDRADNPRKRYPFAETAITHRPARRHAHGRALPGQGLDGLRHQPAPGAARPGGDASAPSRQLDLLVVRGRDPERDRGLGRRGAAGVRLPGTLRRPERRDLPRAVHRAAPAGGRGARRPEAELVDRARARAQARAPGLLPVEARRGVPRHPAPGGGLEPRRAQDPGDRARQAAAGLLRGGRRSPIFPTPSGKIEFYSLQLKAAGFDPVPRYQPTPEPPPGAFRLLYGRAPMHSFSRTQTNPLLQRDDAARTRSGSTPRGAAPGARERRLGAPAQPGRPAEQPRAGPADRAHPRRLRLHGPRLRPHRARAPGRASSRAPATRGSSPATSATRSWAAPG